MSDGELRAIFERSGWVVRDPKEFERSILPILREVAARASVRPVVMVDPIIDWGCRLPCCNPGST